MKLAPLLAQYLYSHKKLSLPGIGVINLDPAAYIDFENPKSVLPAGAITFQRDPSTKTEEELIAYISKETGKMKSLATSDLSSYLELMQQFLNIGKPFTMDGIGTLVKNSNGQFDFTAGIPINERITESVTKETITAATDETAIDFKGMYKKQARAGFTLTKAFIALLLFGGIAVAIWGGYALYNKNKDTTTATAASSIPDEIVPVNEDSVTLAQQAAKQQDSLKQIAATPKARPGYKFIFETTPNKNRAIKRYNFVKNINSEINLETKDSTVFDITVNMVVPATDTIRVKDSLNAWYWGKKDILVKIAPDATSNVP